MEKIEYEELKNYCGGINCSIWSVRCAGYIASGSLGCVDQCAVFIELCT